jgi:eukaryotic-like serine/threonine-protein kinase
MADLRPTPPDPVTGYEQLPSRLIGRGAGARPDGGDTSGGAGDPDTDQLVLTLRADQRARWQTGERVTAHAYFREHPDLAANDDAAFELIYSEFLLREELGETLAAAEFLRDYPRFADRLRIQFEFHHALDADAGSVAQSVSENDLTLLSSGFSIASGRETAWRGPPLQVPGYEILRELGRGGMGVVYKARELRLDRIVALKMILAGAHAHPKSALRFLNEAEVIARLRHPNIVQIYGLGDHEGRPFVELEYVEGGSLAESLDGTPWPAVRAAGLIEVLARTVGEAHRQGIIHRDLKPSNVLLTSDREPKITDFGLAKVLDADWDLTRTNSILGTPSYMAPEQAEGGANSIGPSADVYALGAILYELLTGRPPFKAATVMATLMQVRDSAPVAPSRLQPGLPRDAETICLKCLRKDPSRRYLSALELAEDLRRFLDGRPVIARPVGTTERAWRWCRRKPAFAGLALVVAALTVTVLLGAPVMMWKLRRERDDSNSNLQAALVARQLTNRQILQIRLEQARALRLSKQSGQRLQSLAAIGRAAGLLPAPAGPGHSLVSLRNETIESLSLVDLVDENRPIPKLPAYGILVSIDPAFQRFAYQDRRDVVVGDLNDGHELFRIPHPARGHQGVSVTFSPDGRLFSATYDIETPSPRSECIVWNVATRRSILQHEVRGVRTTFSPDGKSLAFNETDESVAILEIETGKIRGRFPGTSANDRVVAFSPSGLQIAISDSDTRVNIFDIETGRSAGTLQGSGRVLVLAWRADGKLLAAGGEEERVHVWDASEHRVVSVLVGHTGSVVALAFRTEDGLLASSAWDGTTRIWDPLAGKELLSANGILCRFSPDERHLAFQDKDRLGVWQFAGGLECRTLHMGIHGNQPQRTSSVTVAYSPDGRILGSAGLDGVWLWDGGDSRHLAHLTTGPTRALEFLPDGRGLITLGQEGLQCWPIANDRAKSSQSLRIGPPATLQNDVDPVNSSIGLSRDGQAMAVALKWNQIAVLNPLEPGAVKRSVFPSTSYVRSLAVSHDGRWTVAGYWRSSPTVQVWDNSTGKLAKTIDSGSDGANSARVAFSPDGRWLVTCEQADYRFWEVGTWAAGRRLGRDSVEVIPGPIAWSNDGRLLAIMASSSGIRFVDSETAEELATLRMSAPRTVTWLAFRPDGRRLAAATVDQRILIWDLPRLRRSLTAIGLDWPSHASLPPDAESRNESNGPSSLAIDVRLAP